MFSQSDCIYKLNQYDNRAVVDVLAPVKWGLRIAAR